MRLGSGSVCGEDVLMDILSSGRTMPRRKVTVNVTSECDLLVLSLVDALQVRRVPSMSGSAPACNLCGRPACSTVGKCL